ncbi:hypothetical protein [Streptomyces brasiliensis]|uniref:Uncharacterized protein n=1 Tax=Streptomyces brasiliensis TaxID=1954 RepID=A0A917LEP0_9ACTN|nr:hypothetical protein [Streptomyces brasiliensis]GGJ60011.1 hypothetical protein GCM10010121_083280 [Streptomyces brasiliensis]
MAREEHSWANHAFKSEVSTTLNNRLRVTRPSTFGSRSRQQYGLLGPVPLTPYATAAVASDHG